jgi:hypothetical protein
MDHVAAGSPTWIESTDIEEKSAGSINALVSGAMKLRENPFGRGG